MLNVDNSTVEIKNAYDEEIDLREPVVLTEKARERIITELGFIPTEDVINTENNIITPSGTRLIIKLYTAPKGIAKDIDGSEYEASFFLRKDGTKSNIIMAKPYEHHDLHTTCVGLVVAMNRSCYQQERFKTTGPFCRLGDWVEIPRNEGALKYLKGHPVYTLYDDRILSVVSDPTSLRRE